MRKSFAAAFCVLLAAMSFGASVWTGKAGDGKWDTAGNWDPEGVPNSSSTDVVISNPDVGTTLTINLSSAVSFRNLTLGGEGHETDPIVLTESASNLLKFYGPLKVYTDASALAYIQSNGLSAPVQIADGKKLTVSQELGGCILHGLSGGTFEVNNGSLTKARKIGLRRDTNGYPLHDILYIDKVGTVFHGANGGEYKIKNVALTISNGKQFSQNTSGTSHHGAIKIEGYFCVTNAGTATLLTDYYQAYNYMCSVDDTNASFTKAGAGVLTFANCLGTEADPWNAPATFEEGGAKFNHGAYITGTLTLGSAGKTFTLTKGTSGEIKANTLVYNGLTLSGYAVNDVVATTVKRPANRCQPVKATIGKTTYDYYLYWEKSAGGYNVTLVDHFIKPSGLVILIQ